MAAKFDTLFETLAQPTLEAVFAVSVTLTRGANTSAAFSATFSERVYEVYEDGEVMTVVSCRDWIMTTTNYATTTTLTPRAGDVITSGTETYEVLPLGKLPCYELLSGDYRWLIHTKRVS